MIEDIPGNNKRSTGADDDNTARIKGGSEVVNTCQVNHPMDAVTYYIRRGR
jgi:hypothetical protein